MELAHQIVLEGDRPCNVYTCQFSKFDNGSIFAAGGKGGNEVHFFDTKTYNKFQVCENYPKAIYCMDFSPVEPKVAIGCADGQIQFINYAKSLEPSRPDVTTVNQSSSEEPSNALVFVTEESKNS